MTTFLAGLLVCFFEPLIYLAIVVGIFFYKKKGRAFLLGALWGAVAGFISMALINKNLALGAQPAQSFILLAIVAPRIVVGGLLALATAAIRQKIGKGKAGAA